MSEPPATPPTQPGPVPPQAPPNPLEAYHKVADTVGMVPSLRVKDNLIQAAIVLGGILLGATIGYFVRGGLGMLAGAVGGMIVSAFLSGLVLMVLGWYRAARK
jgi:hypothetical protein